MAVADQLRSAAGQSWPMLDWATAEVRSGAFHVVLLPRGGDVVLRATVGNDFVSRARREAGTVRTLSAAGLATAVPELRSELITSQAWSAYLISRLPGALLNDDDLDPAPVAGYRQLLSDLRRVECTELRDLPVPRAWCGGAAWPDVVAVELAPLLPEDSRCAAQERVYDLLQSEVTGSEVLCHGDFGPHNILWRHGSPSGLIDLDHACIGDPAIDVAPLIGFHGVTALRELAPPDLLRRAMRHRATLSLQVAAAAHLAGAESLRDHALGNFATRHRRRTLFDPGGSSPDDLR